MYTSAAMLQLLWNKLVAVLHGACANCTSAPIFVTHHSQNNAEYEDELEHKNAQITTLKTDNKGLKLSIDTGNEQQRAAAEKPAIDAVKVHTMHYMQAQYIQFVM
jgi:hypothetical protein